MKWIFTIVLLFLMMTGSVMAIPIAVDFGPAAGSQDIYGANSFTIGAVTFNAQGPSAWANVDELGVNMDPLNSLNVNFSYYTTALTFSFVLYGIDQTTANQLIANADLLNNNQAADPTTLETDFIPTGAFQFTSGSYNDVDQSMSGTVTYSGAAFNQAILYPAGLGVEFDVTSMTYESPEPGTIFLLLGGLAALCVPRLMKRRA